MENEEKTAPLDPKIADRLLDRLSTEDGFRELFKSNPRAALEEVGYQAPQEAFHSCCNVRELASKETITKARDEIKAMLITGLAYHTPQLDAGLTDERRTRK